MVLIRGEQQQRTCNLKKKSHVVDAVSSVFVISHSKSTLLLG